MNSFIQFVGPDQSLQVFGIRLLGLDVLTARKLLFTVCFFLLLCLVSALFRALAKAVAAHKSRKTVFWTRQAVSLVTFLFGALGFLSIWFDNPSAWPPEQASWALELPSPSSKLSPALLAIL